MANDESWSKIFQDCNIYAHNFDHAPFHIKAEQIKRACQDFTEVGQKEVRILCKQDTREDRPQVFIESPRCKSRPNQLLQRRQDRRRIYNRRPENFGKEISCGKELVTRRLLLSYSYGI